MDVVYLCRAGENEELRYSLRSLVNLPHEQVWVFGGRPNWLTGVRYKPVPQTKQKNVNARHNLESACRDIEVSDPFILMNDDFYIVEPIDALPAMHRGTVAEVIAEQESRGIGESSYTSAMRTTRARLVKMGYSKPLSYSLHVPMVVGKADMLAAIAAGEGIDRAQYRTLYGNIAGIGGVKVPDVKLITKHDAFPDGPFASTSDRTFSAALPRLKALFPDPCQYEREGVASVSMYKSPARVVRDGHLIAYKGQEMTRAAAVKLGLIAPRVPSPTPPAPPSPDYSLMTVYALKALLDDRCVSYPTRALKADLVALAEGVWE